MIKTCSCISTFKTNYIMNYKHDKTYSCIHICTFKTNYVTNYKHDKKLFIYMYNNIYITIHINALHATD